MPGSPVKKANGEDIKVVQELLRHANSKITMDIYTQALAPAILSDIDQMTMSAPRSE